MCFNLEKQHTEECIICDVNGLHDGGCCDNFNQAALCGSGIYVYTIALMWEDRRDGREGGRGLSDGILKHG